MTVTRLARQGAPRRPPLKRSPPEHPPLGTRVRAFPPPPSAPGLLLPGLLLPGLPVLGLLAAFLLGPSPAARAQSVDHGALELLFGEPVTTSATGTPRRVSEAPVNMEIITQADIRRSGATNLPDILRFTAGLDVRRYGSVDANVAVRGYNGAFNPRLLVMVNGRHVYIDSYGYVAWQLIPVQLGEIRQIEIVKGPNSALFGFNAASGVINIITFDPLFDKINTATLALGPQRQRLGSAVATIHLGDAVGARLSMGGQRRDEYRPIGVWAPSLPFQRDPLLGSLSIDTKARIAPGVEVTVEATTSTAQNTDVSFAALTTFNTFHANSLRAGIMADTAWGTIAVSAWRTWYGSTTASAATGPDALPVQNAVYVLQASDTVRLNEAHTLRVSLEYRHNAATSARLFGGTIGYDDHALSGMWDWRITPRLTMTHSARVDYLALYYSGALIANTGLTNAAYGKAAITQPGFNSGLVYRPTERDTLRLTLGLGSQAPSLIAFGIQYPGDAASGRPPAIGSPSLRPTKVWNLELGYDREIKSIGSTLRAAVFAQRNEDLLTPGTNVYPSLTPGGGVALVSRNTGHSDAIGGEIGIRGHSASGFRWNASYAWMVIADHTSINQGVVTSPQDYRNGTPVHVVVLGGGYTWEKLEIDAQARWQSRFTDYRLGDRGLAPVVVGDYVTFRARIGYALTEHVTLALAAEQLHAARLAQSSGPPVERGVLASITARF